MAGGETGVRAWCECDGYLEVLYVDADEFADVACSVGRRTMTEGPVSGTPFAVPFSSSSSYTAVSG